MIFEFKQADLSLLTTDNKYILKQRSWAVFVHWPQLLSTTGSKTCRQVAGIRADKSSTRAEIPYVTIHSIHCSSSADTLHD